MKRGETIANCTEGKAPTFCTTLISTAAIAHLRFLEQRSLWPKTEFSSELSPVQWCFPFQGCDKFINYTSKLMGGYNKVLQV